MKWYYITTSNKKANLFFLTAIFETKFKKTWLFPAISSIFTYYYFSTLNILYNTTLIPIIKLAHEKCAD